MECISHEACSLAGTLKLSKLIVFYDDNGISIDGRVENWFDDNTHQRFESYGWKVQRDVDGNDTAAVDAAVEQATEEAETGKEYNHIDRSPAIGKEAAQTSGNQSKER